MSTRDAASVLLHSALTTPRQVTVHKAPAAASLELCERTFGALCLVINNSVRAAWKGTTIWASFLELRG